MKRYQGVIFDMDGTILDTAADLTGALKFALGKNGCQNDFTTEEGKLFIGSGIYVAILRALAYGRGRALSEVLAIGEDGKEPAAEDLELADRIKKDFKAYYIEHSEDQTVAYPGIAELLSELKERGMKLAVASNKIHEAAVLLAEKYFPGLFDLAIGESRNIERKPAPAMIRYILGEWDLLPEEVVYVGDSDVDLITARNGGLSCISVDWGFRSRECLIEKGATKIAHTPEELRNMFFEPA